MTKPASQSQPGVTSQGSLCILELRTWSDQGHARSHKCNAAYFVATWGCVLLTPPKALSQFCLLCTKISPLTFKAGSNKNKVNTWRKTSARVNICCKSGLLDSSESLSNSGNGRGLFRKVLSLKFPRRAVPLTFLVKILRFWANFRIKNPFRDLMLSDQTSEITLLYQFTHSYYIKVVSESPYEHRKTLNTVIFLLFPYQKKVKPIPSYLGQF